MRSWPLRALAVALASASARHTTSDTSINASDPRINFVGRFLDDVDDTKTFAWTASQIGVTFEGSSIEASLYGSTASDRFLVLVDGEEVSELKTKATTWKTFTLAEGLDASGNHSVVLWKATEDNSQKKKKGAASFAGLLPPVVLDGEPLMSTTRLDVLTSVV